jgi:hypothetical protein
MDAVTVFRGGLAAIWIFAIVIGLRARLPVVKMNAPIGLMGLGSSSLYFFRDAVDHTLLVTFVVIVFVIGSCWMLHLLSQQRSWLKSRNQ